LPNNEIEVVYSQKIKRNKIHKYFNESFWHLLLIYSEWKVYKVMPYGGLGFLEQPFWFTESVRSFETALHYCEEKKIGL